MKYDYDKILYSLSKSKFRSSFHLNKKMKEYTVQKGIDTIKEHAYDMIMERIGGASPKNDGRQTPMKGHPVFIAQHACACCCRGCLYKWHQIPEHRVLTADEIDYVVGLLCEWIKRELY